MIREALSYPLERENWLKTLLLGGLFTLFSFLLIPQFLTEGYLIRVLRDAVDEEAEPPAFGQWRTLL